MQRLPFPLILWCCHRIFSQAGDFSIAQPRNRCSLKAATLASICTFKDPVESRKVVPTIVLIHCRFYPLLIFTSAHTDESRCGQGFSQVPSLSMTNIERRGPKPLQSWWYTP